MRRLGLIAASTSLATALLATAASAQTATTPSPATQPAATAPAQDPRDPDGDHRASWDEYRTAMLANFTRLDANKDGVLESAELPQQPPPKPGQKLPRTEFESGLRASFDRLDANKDGYLADAEFPGGKK